MDKVDDKIDSNEIRRRIQNWLDKHQQKEQGKKAS